jgi:tryptophan-rich sensory protein
VIGPVWITLEVLLATTGYRLLRAPSTPLRAAAVASWGMTLVGLAGYPWLFFRKKRLAASALTSASMLVSATGLAVAAREVDKPAAAMTVPLMAWLSFATLLSEELWRRNPRLSRD